MDMNAIGSQIRTSAGGEKVSQSSLHSWTSWGSRWRAKGRLREPSVNDNGEIRGMFEKETYQEQTTAEMGTECCWHPWHVGASEVVLVTAFFREDFRFGELSDGCCSDVVT